MSSPQNFTSRIAGYIPQWLASRPGLQKGFAYLYTVAALCDMTIQAAVEGVRAAWPGFDGRSDNLDLIGQSRGLVQGETETAVSFQARLQNWLATAKDMGGDVGLARELHFWLGNNPMVRIWSRNGRCTTVAADGTPSQVVGVLGGWSGPGPLSGYGLNWDSVSNPERAEQWWDNWIVIYPSEFASAGTLGARAGGVNTPSAATPGLGIGHLCTRKQYDTVRGLIATWKGQHAVIRWVIWSTDPTLFDPAHPTAAGNPNGKWGSWSFLELDPNGSGKTSKFCELNATCRYWGAQS